MTKPSAAQKRKKRRAEREELQRIEAKAQHTPVSNLTQPPFDPSTPTLVDNGALADTLVPHAVHNVHAVPTAPQPAVGAPRQYYTPSFRFPEHWLYENVPVPPSQWPEHIREYVYGPASPAPSSWANDIPKSVAAAAIMSVAHAPRDWSTICTVGGHPWRAIRRRKRRLRTECSWERHAHLDAPPEVPAPIPSPPLPVPPEPLQQGLSLRPADLLDLTPLHSDDPFHPDDVPPDDLPPPSLCLFPDDHPPSEFPVATEFGEVFHELAHACSRALPASQMALLLRDTVWPLLEYPDSSIALRPDARPELVALLSPDQLIFLCAILVMGRLEPHFALFFDKVVVDFVHSWVHHCELVGEPG